MNNSSSINIRIHKVDNGFVSQIRSRKFYVIPYWKTYISIDMSSKIPWVFKSESAAVNETMKKIKSDITVV